MTQPNPFLPQQPPAQPQQGFQQGQATYPPAAQPQFWQPVQQPAPQAQPYGQYGHPAPGAQPAMVAQAGGVGTLAPPPPAGNREATPKVTNLKGRLLIIVPTGIERGLVSTTLKDKNGNPKIQDRMTADVVVLDGPPLQWGGETADRPLKAEQIPHVIKGMWFSQRNIITQCEPAIAARAANDAANALNVTRLYQSGPAQNDPYVLVPPTAQDVALFNAFIAHTNPYALP